MAANPNPSRITDELWWAWEQIRDDTPGVRYGGTYVRKRCYHGTVDDNQASWPDAYCIQLPLDLRGPHNKTRAIDATMSREQMILRTRRLRDSALDPDDDRLFGMREFYGTLNGDTVYGLIKDDENGPWRRSSADSSHLWHHHGSFFSSYVISMLAMRGYISVWVGESHTEWLRGGSNVFCKYGDRGTEEVEALQRALKYDVGTYDGAIDKDYGPKTRTAVAAMSKMIGGSITGDRFDAIGYVQLNRLLRKMAAEAAATEVLKEMRRQLGKLEDKLSNIPNVMLPNSITFDLPDTITVPIITED